MTLVQKPVIEQTYEENKQGLLISPNLMFVNKDIYKKQKAYKQLIVWFDIVSNGIPLDLKRIKPNIMLTEFKFQLILTNNNNYQPLLIDKKDVISFNFLEIKHDQNGKRIDNKVFITYEIEANLLNDVNHFMYILEYKNSDSIGLTSNNIAGKNKGNIIININNAQYKFVNIISYLNNDTYLDKKNSINIINEDELELNYQQINKLQSTNKPIIKIKTKNTINKAEAIYSQKYLVDKINEINSINNDENLIVNDNNLIVKNKNNDQEIYFKQGNEFNFQNNKYELRDSNNIVLDSNAMKIKFSYKSHECIINLPITDLKEKIIVSDNKTINKAFYITYSDIHLNTKFNDFIEYRKNHFYEA